MTGHGGVGVEDADATIDDQPRVDGAPDSAPVLDAGAGPATRLPTPNGFAGALSLIACTAVLVGVWELYARARDSRVLPTPSGVAAAFWDLFSSGELVEAAVPSLQLLLTGWAIAIAIGIVVGFVVGRIGPVEATLSPYLAALYVTPDLALVPIIVVWFGYGFSGKLVIVVIASVFPMIYNVMAGAKAAPHDLQDMARSFQASRLTIVREIVLPASLPYIFAGLKQSIGRGVVGMVIAEAYLQLGGLGSLVFYYGGRFAPDYLIASIAILPIIGLLCTGAVGLLERRLTAWSGT